MLGVLRRRNFALLWFSGLISVAGDWVLFAALPYFVYQETGSTVATAGMTAAELAPAILLSSIAGVFVDRWDRRRILLISNLAQAATVLALLLVPQDGFLWVVYVVAALQSTMSAFAHPAESALLPTLVPSDLLFRAISLNALNNRLARLVGVPLGAALFAWGGLGAVVVTDVLSFLAAGVLVSLLVVPRKEPAPEDDAVAKAESALRAFWVEWVEGLGIVRRSRTIGVLFVVFGLMTFGGTMMDPLIVAWVRDFLQSGADVYALLLVVHSCAGIVGSLLVGWFGGGIAPRSLIGWASVIAGSVLLVRFNIPVVWVAVVLTVVGGVTSVASLVGVETLAQQRVPEEMRGRVFGSLQATIWLLSLLGAVVGGVAAEVLGLLPMLDTAAVLTALSGAVVLLAIPRRDDRVRPEPERRQ